MHRQALLHQLAAHQPADTTEQAMLTQTIDFVTAQPDCFHRTLLIGHVTGSAWIVSRTPAAPAERQVVLLHHRKLDRWFQPGGHADGDPDVAAVALREAQEETGLTSLRLASLAVFDVDVHPIPARGTEPAHLHYDIRFLLEADPTEPFIETAETKAVRWVNVGQIADLNDSESILRMKRKTDNL
ncbi:MAG: NUDIX hydrolase [Bacteroidetes bacterium]|nr:NUDIX hydrolase [Fibrella sp.]